MQDDNTRTEASPTSAPYKCPHGLQCSGDGWDCIEAGRTCAPTSGAEALELFDQLFDESGNIKPDAPVEHWPHRIRAALSEPAPHGDKGEALKYFNALWAGIEKHMGVDPDCAHWPEVIRAALTTPEPAQQSDENLHIAYLKGLADGKAQPSEAITRDGFHDAFWEAFKSLDKTIRDKFSIEAGREFANTIYDLMKREQ